MAGIFNKAYDQADRILNGSGLSSIVYRQGAGRIATDTWNRIPNYMKQYGKGIVNKILYETTGKKLSDTTREDLTKGEVAALEEAISEAIVTGKGEFKGFGTTHKDWASSMAKEGVGGSSRKDVEALVGGATVSWNPETGEYEINDAYDFKDYGWTLPEILQGKAFPSNPLFGIALGLGHKLVGEAKDEKYWDPTFKGKEQGLYRNAITGKIETGLENPGKFRTRHVPYPGALKTRIGIRPQKLQDISEKHDFFGVEDRNLSGLEGYSEETSPSGVTTSFIDDMAIDTTSGLKHGGQAMSRGLSGINKTININGQPHSLAWINPDEASALKAMGGSGKKVGGIPAYYYGYGDYTDEVSDFSSYMDEGGADIMGGTTSLDALHGGLADRYTSPEARLPFTVSYEDAHAVEPVTDVNRVSRYYTPIENIADRLRRDEDKSIAQQEQGQTQGYTWRDPYPDKDKGPAGGVPYYGGSDPLTTDDIAEGRFSRKLIPYYNALKDRGMSNEEVAAYLSGMGPDALASMREASDTGYSFGGPMGTMQGLTRDMAIAYAKKLKLKELEDEIENLDDKLSSEERTAQIRDIFSRYDIPELGTLTAIKDLKGMGSDIEATAIKHGISPTIAKALSWAAPGVSWSALIAGAGNALAALAGVRGEFETKGGKRFRVMRGGELVEPDLPSVPDEGNVPVTRRPRPRPVQQVSVSEEVEKPLTGIAGLQARRPEVASIGPSLQPQFDNLASIFGRDKAAEMLNQPVNIFA